MGYSKDKISDFKQNMLQERLALCDEKQRAFFARIYPDGPAGKDMDSAIALVDRTISINAKRREAGK